MRPHAALLLLCTWLPLVAQPATAERLIVRYRPGMQEQVSAGHSRPSWLAQR